MPESITPREVRAFQRIVRGYYANSGRHDLPWRLPGPDGTFDPYSILVSEVMLQQTQVSRVIPKFQGFIAQFPTARILAEASLGEVLIAWSGLGYNRRAKFLWQAAGRIMYHFGGIVPQSHQDLVTLPGIGSNTAGATIAYAFNKPVVYIETNIRTVFIHHFYKDQASIPDTHILELVKATLPKTDVRAWYWALMDYGTHLKQTVGNASQRSKVYAKQSAFHGSRRQIRGKIIKLLTTGAYTKAQLVQEIGDERVPAILEDLSREGLVTKFNDFFTLTIKHGTID